MSAHHYDIIRSYSLTEKSTLFAENKYVFIVDPKANKTEIKASVEEIFKVKVSKVNVINLQGKIKRFKGRLGKRADSKKAIVTLFKEYNIDLAGTK